MLDEWKLSLYALIFKKKSDVLQGQRYKLDDSQHEVMKRVMEAEVSVEVMIDEP